MSLYSVMLVDDEEEVIQIIMKKLDWASMGFQIVGYAHNGAEALELAEECQPDVVMTDIKMPYMDGLELSRRLKERYPSIRIIIFSGFDEFEYAKEAIRIEVEEYILKPIDAGELQELFGRIKKSLDKEIDEKRNIDKLQEYYMESLPLLQENFFTSLFEGRVPAEEIDKYLVNYPSLWTPLSGDDSPLKFLGCEGLQQSVSDDGLGEKAGGRAAGAEIRFQDVDLSRGYHRDFPAGDGGTGGWLYGYDG